MYYSNDINLFSNLSKQYKVNILHISRYGAMFPTVLSVFFFFCFAN